LAFSEETGSPHGGSLTVEWDYFTWSNVLEAAGRAFVHLATRGTARPGRRSLGRWSPGVGPGQPAVAVDASSQVEAADCVRRPARRALRRGAVVEAIAGNRCRGSESCSALGGHDHSSLLLARQASGKCAPFSHCGEGKPMSGNPLAENRYCSTPDAPFALSWKSTFLTGHNQAIHVVIARKGPRSGFLISNHNNISMLRHPGSSGHTLKPLQNLAFPLIWAHPSSTKPQRASLCQKRKDDAK
jgi:hypothetical protein